MTEDQGKQTSQAQAARRIAALLAMAEDAAKNNNEALRDTYLEKASALQLQYVIDEAQLAAERGKDHKKEEIIWAEFCQESNTPLIKAKREMITTLAGTFRGRAVLMAEYKQSGKDAKLKLDRRAKIRVYAYESDLAFITMMYTSLVLQMQSMMAADEKIETFRLPDRKQMNGWRVSYAHAWVRRVYSRLLADKARQEREATAAAPGTALVLRDRKQDVDNMMNTTFGKLRSSRYKDGAGANAAGQAAGRAAGDRADLNNKAKVEARSRGQLGS